VKTYINYLYLCGQSALILICVAVCTISIMAQQPTTSLFQKPAWLNCYDEGREYPNKEIERRILYEYGAVYLSTVFETRKNDEKIPCLFGSQDEIKDLTKKFLKEMDKFIFGKFYLQAKAKAELLKVFKDLGGAKFVARNCNSKPKDCTNGINNDWSLRDYRQTMCNWTNQEDCDREGLLPIDAELAVLDPSFDIAKKYSEQATNRPMMFKFAIPGGSQHHLGLAIDVNNGTGNSDSKECKKSKTCRVCGNNCISSLEKHGWYRTVKYDPYHFTFLGFSVTELPSKGLKQVKCKDNKLYWVPRVETYEGYPNWRCDDVSIP